MSFLDDIEKNLYDIKHLNDNNYSISDFDFTIEYENEVFSLKTSEDFIQTICTKVTEKKVKDLNQLFSLLTQEYELEITKDMKEDSPLYQNQDVFEVDNDNHDIKFVERIRWTKDDFNMDLFLNIFDFLDPNHLFTLNRVSKEWKVLTENEKLWERICQRQDMEKTEKTWRKSFSVIDLPIENQKGLLMYIGTDGFKGELRDPKEFGVKTFASSTGANLERFISLKPGVTVVSGDSTCNSFIGFDISLTKLKFLPTAYWIQHRNDFNDTALRYWEFEASNDNILWDTLMSHNNDQLLNAQVSSEAKWKIEPTPKKYYSMFRIRQTGNSTGPYIYLGIGQIELYGMLKRYK